MSRKVDFCNLDRADQEVMINAVHMISQYELEKRQIMESIKETLDVVVEKLGCDKPSAVKAKKIIKKVSAAYIKNKTDEASEEAIAIDVLLQKLVA